MTEKEYEEITLTSEQLDKLKVLLEEKKEKKFFNKMFCMILGIATLKNSGKWVSILTLSLVLFILAKFVNKHDYSVEAMDMVLPFLTQIAILVFSVIGGVKGLEGLIDKINKKGELIDSINNVASKFKKTNME